MVTISKVYRLVMLVGLLCGPIACKKQEAPQNAEAEHAHESEATDLIELTDDQLRIASVELGKVEYRTLGQVLQLNGRLAVPAQSQVIITALQGGFVRSIPLLPGQPVRKGQILARIENPDLIQIQQEYAENHSRLTYLEAEYARQQELSRENVSALKVLQQTTADLNATQARLMGLSERLRRVGLSPQATLDGKFSAYYVLTAPVSGVVTDVPATSGQYVQPTDVVARLVSRDGLYAELTVFEKDLPKIRQGQRVRLLVNNEGGRERTGHISFVNQAVDADRSVRVVAKLDQSDTRLTPNTFLKASLDTGASRVTALPEEAIVAAEGKDYIFIATTEQAPKHHESEETGHNNEHQNAKSSETDHQGTIFKQISVRRGVTESGYSQVILPTTIDWTKTQVVTKGAYALLSQLKAVGGEEDEHGH